MIRSNVGRSKSPSNDIRYNLPLTYFSGHKNPTVKLNIYISVPEKEIISKGFKANLKTQPRDDQSHRR